MEAITQVLTNVLVKGKLEVDWKSLHKEHCSGWVIFNSLTIYRICSKRNIILIFVKENKSVQVYSNRDELPVSLNFGIMGSNIHGQEAF